MGHEVHPGNGVFVLQMTEQKTEDDPDDRHCDNRGSANDVISLGRLPTPDDVDRADDQHDGRESVGENGEEAQVVGDIATLDCDHERSTERRERE